MNCLSLTGQGGYPRIEVGQLSDHPTVHPGHENEGRAHPVGICLEHRVRYRDADCLCGRLGLELWDELVVGERSATPGRHSQHQRFLTQRAALVPAGVDEDRFAAVARMWVVSVR